MNSLLKTILISSEQKTRISKCHYQSIYLLEKTKTYDSIILKVSGSTLNVYTVTIKDLVITCDCPDSYHMHEIIFCKHICFVICVIGKIYDDNIFIKGRLTEDEKMDIIFILFNIPKD